MTPPKNFYYDRGRRRAERATLWVLIGALVLLIGAKLVGCTAASEGPPNERTTTDATVMLRGTLSDPEVGWEYSRNDARLNVDGLEEAVRLRDEYMRHLNTTIRTTDRQTTHNGLVCDRFTTETRIESK